MSKSYVIFQLMMTADQKVNAVVERITPTGVVSGTPFCCNQTYDNLLKHNIEGTNDYDNTFDWCY